MKTLINNTFPIPQHETWNVLDPSKMQAYMDCPRRFFWEYVAGWRRDAPNIHLHFGQAWHEAMDHLLLNDYSIESVQEAHAKLEEIYRQEFPPDVDELYEPKTPTRALLALAGYSGRFKDDLKKYEVLYTETAGTVPIAEDRILHFRMDSIVRELRTGKITSLEHKTGSNTWRYEAQWQLKMQVGCYTHCLYCMYPIEEVLGIIISATFFKKVKKCDSTAFDYTRVPVYKTPAQMNAWLWTANEVYGQIEYEYGRLADCTADDDVMRSFPCNTESCTKYLGCPYHDFCQAWSNPLSQIQVGPQPGFKIEFWDPREHEATHEMELKI